MFGSLVYCLSVTLIGSLLFGECCGKLSDKEKALIKAAKNKQWDEMIRLAKEGVNVGIIDEEGRSIINHAAANSNAQVVDELITVGATHIVDKRISMGDKGNREKMIKTMTAYLLNREPDSFGYPISQAVYKGDKAIFKVLLNHGADPMKDKTLLSALANCNKARMSESLDSHKEMARILINTYKFDVNGSANSQVTPLHKAALHDCDQEFMEIFTSEGADVNACDERGQTPLHMAVECDNSIAVAALIKLGADLQKKDNQGRTALKLAEAEWKHGREVHGEKQVAELLRKADISLHQAINKAALSPMLKNELSERVKQHA